MLILDSVTSLYHITHYSSKFSRPTTFKKAWQPPSVVGAQTITSLPTRNQKRDNNGQEPARRDQLVGVYLFGSAGYGAYESGTSDIDVQAIVRGPLDTVDKQAVISRLNQNALPCPATKLEFVVYAQSAVYPASRHPRFELNLNTGAHQPDHISLDPANESSHWFLLDIAVGRELGRALYGPATTDAFGAIPRRWVLEAIATSLEWHQAKELRSSNSVLNACRGWRYIVTGEFSSKLVGAKWAMQQQGSPDVVSRAISARKTGDELPVVQIMTLYHIVIMANRAELAKDLM